MAALVAVMPSCRAEQAAAPPTSRAVTESGAIALVESPPVETTLDHADVAPLVGVGLGSGQHGHRGLSGSSVVRGNGGAREVSGRATARVRIWLHAVP